MKTNDSELNDLIEIYESESEYLDLLSDICDEIDDLNVNNEFIKKQEKIVEIAYNNVIDKIIK